jgi:alpha-tubulin suppressor-like RCC1 family protein
LALRFDGEVLGWGANQVGQLGHVPNPFHSTPVNVPGLPGAVAVAAGGSHALALLSDGTVFSWGGNAFHQLGDGTTTSRHIPKLVAGISGVTALAAGSAYSLVVP